MDNKCMIIKKREYATLQKELEELRNSQQLIKINITDSRSFYFSKELIESYDTEFSETINLSEGIKDQVWRILAIVKNLASNKEAYLEAVSKKILEDNKQFYLTKIENVKKQFSELSWYKRLFFKPEYLD